MAPVLISVGEMPTSVDPLPPADGPGAGAGAPGVGACLPGAGAETAGEAEPPGALLFAAAGVLNPAGEAALAVDDAGEGDAEGEADAEAEGEPVGAGAAADCGALSAVGAVSGAAADAAGAGAAFPGIGLADGDLGPLPQAARMSAPLTMTVSNDPARVNRIPRARIGVIDSLP